MKVSIEDKVYLVHFETRRNPSKELPNRLIKELTTIKCLIRRVLSDGSKEEVASGEAAQHYNDVPNGILGRKIAFTNALGNLVLDPDGIDIDDEDDLGLVPVFSKEERTAFWAEYKKNSRYDKKASLKSQNLRLKRQLALAEANVRKLEQVAACFD